MSVIGIIIPTWNNNEYLLPCLRSLLSPIGTEDMVHIYVVNNGEPQNMQGLEHPRVTVLQQKDNLGWEGGLKAGLVASKEDFIVFMNDDTFVPLPSVRWTNTLINHFARPEVAAVGPSSNCVMGVQNIFSDLEYCHDVLEVNFLVGFCVMIRRSALEAVGGVDDSLPGGDDLDLSIRLRQKGYKLLCDRNVLIYHHGFKTGERVKGGPEVVGGWNSIQMTERTNFALMEKHGLVAWMDCMNQVPALRDPRSLYESWIDDSEGDVCRKYVAGDMILEIGCGMRKTVPQAMGVDRVPKGELIRGVAPDLKSVADITADVKNEIPVESGSFDTVIARHVLEHITPTIQAIRHWGKPLKKGGRLIIAVPNHELRNTIPMNIEHSSSFTPRSLRDLMEALGWKTVKMLDPQNLVSFVGVFEKTDAVRCEDESVPMELEVAGSTNGYHE